MSLLSVNTILEAAAQIPADWADQDLIPAPVLESLEYAPGWAETDRQVRGTLIGQIAGPERPESLRALYLLWNWEPEPTLRAEIVDQMGARQWPGAVKALRKVMLGETPDEGGKLVRERVAAALARISSGEEETQSASERGAVLTSGGPAELAEEPALPLKGATMVSGGPWTRGVTGASAAEVADATAALREFAALRNSNPWF